MDTVGRYEHPDEFSDAFDRVCVGVQNHTDQQGIHSHWHERMEILLMRQGRLQLICGNDCFEVLPGGVAFINPNEIHMGQFLEPQNQTVNVIFHLDLLHTARMDEADRQLDGLRFGRLRIVHLVEQDDSLARLVERMDTLVSTPSSSLMQVKACLMEILAAAFAHYSAEDSTVYGSGSSLLPKLLTHLHSHYSEPLTLQDLADYSGFSKTHFCRWFKKQVGESPMDYLNTIRLQKASQLLHQTRLTLLDIALCCGFQSLNYFSRKFKEYFGYPPSSVRLSPSDHSGNSQNP